MNMNPMQMLQMIRGGNPQQIAMNLLRQNAGNNPMLKNVLDMAEKGDYKGIEEFGRNICNEKGLNANEVISQIKSQIGI